MAKKNTSPIITHTEIICYAIRAIDAEIAEWHTRCSGYENCDALVAQATDHLYPKLAALQELYRFETGQEYCD